MNVTGRLEKLENRRGPEGGLCECINGILTEFRKDPDESHREDDVPVYCETCRLQRRKIIVQFVRARTLEAI